MIIAHRGYAKNFKENTIAAFNAALNLGADAIETDVRLTKDNKAVINHDDEHILDGEEVKISNTSLDYILMNRNNSQERMLTIEELFEYINKNNITLHLEIKDNSKIHFELIIDQIQKYNFWDKIYLLGFSGKIKTALKFQDKYPKLRVSQILRFPLYSYIKKPQKSYGVYLGWLDGVNNSELIFKKIISINRLKKLKKYFEDLGFHVMGGVINREDGIKYLTDAGINDIFTDETELCHKLMQQF